ncbi:MAG: ribbon-helix-helix protein, CopG family [Nitrospira sp.]|nr:ribbon-helix-helix protein, CopG family [Nitrospira sp.]
MSRPKLTERITIRLPEELLQDLTADAARRNSSINEVVLGAIERDLSFRLTYRCDYYAQLRTLGLSGQGDNVSDFPRLSDTKVRAV